MGFAVPRAPDPIVFDQASSGWSNGDVQIARREGRALPPGIGVDRDGNPTTDPDAVLEGGALLPFGGHKGSSIAMMMEIMGAALAGGDYSFEIDWSAHPGAATPHGGQTYILIDPNRGNTRDFADRVETLIEAIHDAGQERLPADRRYANRRANERDGIPVSAAELARLRGLADGTR
jgi:delta1-piperideine-2-carboxylate reductase